MLIQELIRRPCHDCGVEPGKLHLGGCDAEICASCGCQLTSCYDCSSAKREAWPRIPWTGIWNGVLEAIEFGWYCKNTGSGFRECPITDPEARTDLVRLVTQAKWSPSRARFILPAGAKRKAMRKRGKA